MADLTNRSRFRVTVKNRDDLTRHFSFNQLDDVEAYMAEKRKQHLKPRVEQLDESWLVRIRDKGHKPLSATFNTRKDAESFIARTTEERSRGLFVDYTASLKVSLAELMVRYLLEEAPKHKSYQVLAYSLEGWLADSGPAGLELLNKYREELTKRKLPVRANKFKMRRSSDELAWIHKPLSEVTTVDVENFIGDRLEAVEPGTVDREIDRLKAIFRVAIAVWDYPLAKNPMDAVRRPKYFNERDRRISDDEERRLLQALANLDIERAVEVRLSELADAALAGQTFSSNSARKKVLAKVRAELLPLAQETAEVVGKQACFDAAAMAKALWKHYKGQQRERLKRSIQRLQRSTIELAHVPALNKDIKTFDSMAAALRYHMYQHVVICNTGEFGGSTAQAPYDEEHRRTISHAHGAGQIAVAVFEVQVDDFGPELKAVKHATTKSVKKRLGKTPPAGLKRRI